MKKHFYLLICITWLNFSCSSEPINSQEQNIIKEFSPEEITEEEHFENPSSIKLLSLGDSYTIGQSVCETCRFPEQLKSRLLSRLNPNTSIQLDLIAKTGWTTSGLKKAINTNNVPENYNLVTLLIGVNNQYQGLPFSVFQSEFPQLVNTAIKKAKSNKNKVIVMSIPDYAYTPFGRGNTNISEEINKYNNFAKNYCLQNNISYVYITDITRQGLTNLDLVATDGLHPSKLAYSLFVDKLLPLSIDKLKN